jgi:hypothetical protein
MLFHEDKRKIYDLTGQTSFEYDFKSFEEAIEHFKNLYNTVDAKSISKFENK